LRIVSGKYKGRSIHPPKNFRARPTTDFAKEGLFDILNNYFEFPGLRVLDLFAGTGSISFEFASRGSSDIELVEADRKHMQFIRSVIRDLDMKGIRPNEMSVFQYLKHPKAPFDIIFCDPPYEMEGIESIPGLLLNNGWLKDEGWLILEHSKKFSFGKHPHLKETRNYGSVHFSIFYAKSD
jgi:16S rRNA (guanine966-N2)-methyltransferase